MKIVSLSAFVLSVIPSSWVCAMPNRNSGMCHSKSEGLKLSGADYADLVQNPPRSAREVKTAAQVRMYRRLISPGGPCSVAQVAEAAGRTSDTIYGQTSGRSPVTLPLPMAMAKAGDPEGACDVLAPLLFAIAADPKKNAPALLGLLHSVAGQLGHTLQPSAQLIGQVPSQADTVREIVEAKVARHAANAASLRAVAARTGMIPAPEAARLEELWRAAAREEQEAQDAVRAHFEGRAPSRVEAGPWGLRA